MDEGLEAAVTAGVTSDTLGQNPHTTVEDQYRTMNHGLHESKYLLARAPCVVAQLGFWLPEGVEWRKQSALLYPVFIALRDALKDWLLVQGWVGESDSASAIDAGERIRSWVWNSKSGAESVQILVSCHTEYWCLQWMIQFASSSESIDTAPESRPFLMRLRAEAGLDQAAGARDLLVDRFAAELERIVAPVRAGAERDHLFEKLVASFFGSVFDAGSDPKVVEIVRNVDLRLSESVSLGSRKPADGWMRLRKFTEPRDLLIEHWAHLSNLHDLGDDAVELTASSMLSCRAIYVSTLAHPATRRLPSITCAPGKVPVVFSIISCTSDPWELGRLLDTINSMGLVRLASLWDIADISDTAQSLRDLRQALKHGSSDIESLRPEIYKLLSKRDIAARIERSARYWSQLHARVRTLDLKIIDGFQPYDQFVQRRIGDTIAFIESTGRQLALVRKELDLRWQDRQSSTLVDLQQTAVLGQKAVLSVQHSAIEVQQNLLNLQRAAEWLSVIPIAYYIGAILKPGFHDLVVDEIALSVVVWIPVLRTHSDVFAEATWVLMMLFASAVFVRAISRFIHSSPHTLHDRRSADLRNITSRANESPAEKLLADQDTKFF